MTELKALWIAKMASLLVICFRPASNICLARKREPYRWPQRSWQPTARVCAVEVSRNSWGCLERGYLQIRYSIYWVPFLTETTHRSLQHHTHRQTIRPSLDV